MHDTDPEQQRRHYERLAALSPEERARIIGAATRRMRTFAEAGLRHYHPGASDEEIRVRLAVRLYGQDAARRMFGGVPPDAT